VVNFSLLHEEKKYKRKDPTLKQWHPHMLPVDLCGAHEVKYGIVS